MRSDCLDDRHDEVLADYQGGMLVSEIVKKYSISDGTFYNWMKLHNIPKRCKTVSNLARDERNKRIIADRLAGMMLEECAEKYGMNFKSISRICIDNGVRVEPAKERPWIYTNIQRANIEYEFLTGVSKDEICSRYGISRSGLYKALKRWGIDVRRWGEIKKKQMIYDRTHGLSCKECCEKYGLSAFTVWRTCKNNGIDLRALNKRVNCSIKSLSFREQNNVFWSRRKQG